MTCSLVTFYVGVPSLTAVESYLHSWDRSVARLLGGLTCYTASGWDASSGYIKADQVRVYQSVTAVSEGGPMTPAKLRAMADSLAKVLGQDQVLVTLQPVEVL